VTIPETDDLGRQVLATGGLDDNAAAYPQLAHRTHDFDEQPLHGLDPAEHFYVVDGVNSCCEGLHRLYPCVESAK
jgi:hypothetical protein